MGFESDDGKGLNIDDLEFLVKGHIKIGYNVSTILLFITTNYKIFSSNNVIYCRRKKNVSWQET
jgi:hypothetical protein